VISPRVQEQDQEREQDLSSIQGKGKNNNSYPQKMANATITLAIVSLMLVLGSTMNAGLIIYMIGHVSSRKTLLSLNKNLKGIETLNFLTT